MNDKNSSYSKPIILQNQNANPSVKNSIEHSDPSPKTYTF